MAAFQNLFVWFTELKFSCFTNTNLSLEVDLGFGCMEYLVFKDKLLWLLKRGFNSTFKCICICNLLLELEDRLCLALTVSSQFPTNLICGHWGKPDQGSPDRTSRASASVTDFASVSPEMLSQVIFRGLSYLQA